MLDIINKLKNEFFDIKNKEVELCYSFKEKIEKYENQNSINIDSLKEKMKESIIKGYDNYE